ncbi:unnamed protein product [Cylicocyclus nassatus]|uniref:G protein-coupled receptor n=1 Tax=Cylicocyclus nassatus TaxID=53992 RepID=A0AA36GWF4_CYLNA|nr:unnamed protein product [Cylicocyclus nassatus]
MNVRAAICISLPGRRGIAAKLQTETSEQTRRLHQQLLKAITYQACIPIFFWFAVLAYALGQLNVLHHPIVEYSVFIFFGFVPAFSPLSSFYCIRPYRMWLMRRVTLVSESVRWSSYH